MQLSAKTLIAAASVAEKIEALQNQLENLLANRLNLQLDLSEARQPHVIAPGHQIVRRLPEQVEH